MQRNISYIISMACVLVFCVSQAVWAQECSPTKRVKAYSYPGSANIYKGNNLTQPKGKPVKADGQPLIIRGRVLDKNCVPVSQALVEIWQLDPFGKRARFTSKSLATVDPVFTGSGRTHTGTDGEFYFFTAFPGAAKNRAPRIHIRIKPEGMAAFSTQLYLGSDERNEKDRYVKRLRESTRDGVTLTMSPAGERGSAFYGDITLTLPGKTKYDEL